MAYRNTFFRWLFLYSLTFGLTYVLKLFTYLCPETGHRDLGRGWKISPSVNIGAGETFTLGEITGPGRIRHIWITTSSEINRTFVLRIYWDDCEEPSVETPLGDFFASADEQQYEQLTSLPVCVNPRKALNCYWDSHFIKNAE